MCTVSWTHQPGGYQLLCNRDEKRTRLPALGPDIRNFEGVSFLSPLDANHGGTWIAVNEFGLTVCLLNDRGVIPMRSKSRGLIVMDLIHAGCSAETTERLTQLDLNQYSPFKIVALETNAPPLLHHWNGTDISTTTHHGDPLLCSSSYDSDGVRAHRHQQFSRMTAMHGGVDADVLFAFHAMHGPRPDAYSPCMHRADAETVSFSWIHVQPNSVEFFYAPGPPCQMLPGTTQVLTRAA